MPFDDRHAFIRELFFIRSVFDGCLVIIEGHHYIGQLVIIKYQWWCHCLNSLHV